VGRGRSHLGGWRPEGRHRLPRRDPQPATRSPRIARGGALTALHSYPLISDYYYWSDDEIWDVRFHLDGNDKLERSIGRADITFFNLLAMIEQEVFGWGDGMYYIREAGGRHIWYRTFHRPAPAETITFVLLPHSSQSSTSGPCRCKESPVDVVSASPLIRSRQLHRTHVLSVSKLEPMLLLPASFR
jgi:hypothetical protein